MLHFQVCFRFLNISTNHQLKKDVLYIPNLIVPGLYKIIHDYNFKTIIAACIRTYPIITTPIYLCVDLKRDTDVAAVLAAIAPPTPGHMTPGPGHVTQGQGQGHTRGGGVTPHPAADHGGLTATTVNIGDPATNGEHLILLSVTHIMECSVSCELINSPTTTAPCILYSLLFYFSNLICLASIFCCAVFV